MENERNHYPFALPSPANLAYSEAQKTIEALTKRFNNPCHIAALLIPYANFCADSDVLAAEAAQQTIYAVCGIETSAEYDICVDCGETEILQSHYADFLLCAFFKFLNREDADAAPRAATDCNNRLEEPSKDPALDKRYQCTLCVSLEDLYAGLIESTLRNKLFGYPPLS